MANRLTFLVCHLSVYFCTILLDPINFSMFLTLYVLFVGRHEVWELGVSSSLTVGGKGGLTSLTKSLISEMNGKNLSLVLPMLKESS